jgi:hypothetical protein
MSDRRLYLKGTIRAIGRIPNVSDYDRQRALSRVLALWPRELADVSAEGRLLICKQLRRAIRAERRRGIGACPTYSVWRLAELLRVYRNELRELRETASRELYVMARALSGIRKAA